MTPEQAILRWVLVIPSLALMLLFLPFTGGGYQYLGVFDTAFLLSGAIDYARLLVEGVALLCVWLLLEQYARSAMDRFPVRDENGFLLRR